MRRAFDERELLDLPGAATRSEIQGNLKDIAASNRWFGGTAVVLGHLSRMISPDSEQDTIRILDLGTGFGDIPVAIVCWARRQGLRVRITAVDSNPMVVELARKNTESYEEICVDQQDILSLPYKDGEFQFTTCSQVIHHLSNENALAALRAANRLSTKGVIVSDLRRSRLCIVLASLASHLIRNRLSAHDLRVSFRNAFTPDELRELAKCACMPMPMVYRHGPCRLALVVDKRTSIQALSREHKKKAQASMSTA